MPDPKITTIYLTNSAQLKGFIRRLSEHRRKSLRTGGAYTTVISSPDGAEQIHLVVHLSAAVPHLRPPKGATA